MAKVTIPTKRRTYHAIYAPTYGLKYDLASTMLPEQYTPRCEEVTMRDGVVSKATGTSIFAQTDTFAVSGYVMLLSQFNKLDGTTKKLVCHTTNNMYYYDTTTKKFVSLCNIGKNLVARTTVRKKTGKNLVCKLTKG